MKNAVQPMGRASYLWGALMGALVLQLATGAISLLADPDWLLMLEENFHRNLRRLLMESAPCVVPAGMAMGVLAVRLAKRPMSELGRTIRLASLGALVTPGVFVVLMAAIALATGPLKPFQMDRLSAWSRHQIPILAIGGALAGMVLAAFAARRFKTASPPIRSD